MPLGILSDDQFNSELNKFVPELIDKSKVIDIKRGRGPTKEMPSSLREVIAEEAIINGNQKAISEAFGISKSQVSAYKNGATSTASYHKPDESLKKHNDDIRENIASSARSRLMMALEEITPDRLAGTKVKDAASIAKDMSAIVRNMEPDQTILNQQNTQVIVYRPRTKDEDEYETIVVNE